MSTVHPIDYTAPGCICASGGMGRHAHCPVHGEKATDQGATVKETPDA